MKLGYHCNRLRHIQEHVLDLGLRRGEFYNLNPTDQPALKKLVQTHHLEVSVHCPLISLDWYPKPPTWAFLCDRDTERRQLNLRMAQDTLERAVELGAEHVVSHFPSPDSTGTAIPYSEQRDIAWGSAQSLAELSQRFGIPIHVEGFGPSPLLEPEFLGQVFTQFSNLHYCFDSGHMSIAARRDGFDFFAFAQAMAPYLGSIHLWNTRGIDDYRTYRHIPVHPCQKPEDGWVDIPRLLSVLRSHRSEVPIILESASIYPPALGNYDFRDGVSWVKQLLAT